MDRGYQGVDSTIANSLLALEEKKRLLEELLWNNNASDYAQNDSIQVPVDFTFMTLLAITG